MSAPPRRSSLGMLLRRSKSGEIKGKKAQALREQQELQRQRDASVSKSPPRLPVLYNGAPAPNLPFGGPDRPDSLAIVSGRADSATPRPSIDPARSMVSVGPPAVPPVPNGAWVDPYARTESMTHRGRYSYASSAISTINSPRRVRRRKDPTPFNILIVGTRNSGKTSFLEFLKTSLALPPKKRSKTVADLDDMAPRSPPSGNFVPHYLETEIDAERIGLTLWDSEGLEKSVVDLQLREMSAFLESKFDETFNEEMKVMRSPGAQDTHIHAVFLVLDPSRLDRNIAASKAASSNGHHHNNNHFHKGGRYYASHARVVGGLDEDLDLQVLRTLQGKTTVIPVISKADTITTKHMNVLKRTVWDSLKKANLDPLEALGLDGDDDDATDNDANPSAAAYPDSGRIDEEADEDLDGTAAPGDRQQRRYPDQDEDTSEQSEADTPGLPIQGGHPPSPAAASKKSAATVTASPNNKRLSMQEVRRNQDQAELADGEVPYIPMSIISPDIYEPGVVGRQFPWGFADPNNDEHCDFLRLKEAVFSEWRGELREASREQWYERWRTSRLNQREKTKGSIRR